MTLRMDIKCEGSLTLFYLFIDIFYITLVPNTHRTCLNCIPIKLYQKTVCIFLDQVPRKKIFIYIYNDFKDFTNITSKFLRMIYKRCLKLRIYYINRSQGDKRLSFFKVKK